MKKDAKLQVVRKNYGNGYSQVWFNLKKCYIPTKNLSEFKTYATLSAIKKLGKAKGTLVIDSPWAALGSMAYSSEALKILKKYKMDEGAAAKKLIACNGMIPTKNGSC